MKDVTLYLFADAVIVLLFVFYSVSQVRCRSHPTIGYLHFEFISCFTVDAKKTETSRSEMPTRQVKARTTNCAMIKVLEKAYTVHHIMAGSC